MVKAGSIPASSPKVNHYFLIIGAEMENTTDLATKLADEIMTITTEFNEQHILFATKGNKAAARRARKASTRLRELLKDYRKISLIETGDA